MTYPVVWQNANYQKITITRDSIRIKVVPNGDNHPFTLLSIAEEAYRDYLESETEFTVRGFLEDKEDHYYVRFQSQHGHKGNIKTTWKTYRREK